MLSLLGGTSFLRGIKKTLALWTPLAPPLKATPILAVLKELFRDFDSIVESELPNELPLETRLPLKDWSLDFRLRSRFSFWSYLICIFIRFSVSLIALFFIFSWFLRLLISFSLEALFFWIFSLLLAFLSILLLFKSFNYSSFSLIYFNVDDSFI